MGIYSKLDFRAKRISMIATAVMTVAVGVFIASAATPRSLHAFSFNSKRNCDSNAVVYCGAMDPHELNDKYNSTPSVRAIYDYFHISSGDISTLGSTAVAGSVTKSGDVIVDGKVVATNAVTAGRSLITPGSNRVFYHGVLFYTRPPAVSFLDNSLGAFVVMQNGKFKFAILPSCGNPIIATPKPTPAPKPTPRPAPSPKPTPQTASLACASLSTSNIGSSQYSFTVGSSLVNATITSYTVNFGDGSQYNGTSNQTVHTYTSPGTYEASASVTGTVNGQTVTSSGNCATNVIVPTPQPMCQIPGKTNLPANSGECVTPATPVAATSTPPPAQPTQLVNTGPGSTIGIFAAITIAGTFLARLFLRRRYQA